MFVVQNLFRAFAGLINSVLSIFEFILIARILLSWVNPDPYNGIVQFIYKITDPVLVKIQKFVPPLGGIDFSPIVAFLAIDFIKNFAVTSLYGIAGGL